MLGNQEFKDQMARLTGYFGKPVTEAQKVEYEKKLHFIPTIALSDIADEIIEGRRPTPGSFPTISRIKKLWWEWQKKHPEKIERRFDRQECRDCYGKGVIWFKRHDDNLNYKIEQFRLCGRCNNWRRHFGDSAGMRFSTIDELKLSGLEVWPYTDRRSRFIHNT